ncbi:ATP-binding cassette domain-containing protein [Streptomyces cadmiisoli]|uniref:ATP-binding cassette domain-containing protein n=1 Tax=Streptomyces cadmiisoli TaxID=2184053 RepID=UPI00364CF405
MIQAFGLTSNPRKGLPPAVDDVSFEARAGRVTALLGDARAGKTTALRLMLELQQGRGLTYFRGRPLHRIAHPTREVGVLLGEVPGHPGRTVHGHLRMLCAAAGVSVRRADEVLEVVGLVSLREERLGTLSRGMDRRLGLACALLSDPHTLVLDDPADGLSARESRWLFGMLRAHADQGGTVLVTTADPKEAARTADRVVTLERGRLVADQEAAEFARTRLRPRVAVRSPQSTRLAAALAKEARTARRSVEVVQERGNRLSVYGSTCADVGETAFRHGILVLQLADEIGDMGPGAGTGAAVDVAVPQEEPEAGAQEAAAAGSAESDARVSAVASEDLADASPSVSDTHAVTVDKAPAEVVAATPETPHATMVPSARRTPPADIYADTYADADSASGARPDAVAKDGAAPAPHPTASPAASRAPHSDVTAKRSPHSDAATSRAPLPESSSGRPAHPDPATNGAPHPTPAANGTAHPAPTVNGTPHPAPTTNGTPHSAAAPNSSPPAAPGAAPKPHPAEPTAAPTSQPATAPAAPARSTTHSTPAAGRATPSPAATQANGGSKPPNGHAKPSLDPVRPSLGPAKPSTAPAIAPHRPTKTPAHPAGLARPSRPTAPATPATPASAATRTSAAPPARPAAPVTSRELESLPSLPPPIAVRAAPSPLRPLRYELRRAAGVSTGFVTAATVLVVSALTAVLLARLGHTPHERLLAAWPSEVPLPPAAIGAGLLGALAFGDEFRHPALAVDRGTVPRRLGLLAAKLAVSGAIALALAVLTVGCNAEVLYLVYGRELARVPADWLSLSASWLGLTVGCAWAGVLAAGVFRSTAGGLAAVVSVPILVVPLVQRLVEGPSVRTAAGFPMRMREMFLLQWPFGGERYLSAVARVISQPVGGALTLSLTALLCAYAVTTLRSRAR